MNNPWRLNLAVGLVAIASGLTGSVCSLFLRSIQHLSFGWHYDGFWLQISHDPPTQRLLILCLCGLVGGVGWWCTNSRILDNILQLLTAGMGSPLGREAAPREISAIFADRVGKVIGVDESHLSTLRSLAAGAALGAIYNVPISGALFAFETLGVAKTVRNIVTAAVISGLSILFSWQILGTAPQYYPVDFYLSASLIIGSAITMPIIWLLGKRFGQYTRTARTVAFTGNAQLLGCILNFAAVGLLSMWLPALLGNGKSAAGLEFASLLSWQSALILLVVRALITLSSVYVGAHGGLLTPSMATGALLGGVLGGLWMLVWPEANMASFGLVGAAVFLGAAQKMPVTACMLILELTGTLAQFWP